MASDEQHPARTCAGDGCENTAGLRKIRVQVSSGGRYVCIWVCAPCETRISEIIETVRSRS